MSNLVNAVAALRRFARELLYPPADPGRLVADARNAAAVRAHHTDPDVIALVVARTRDAVDRLMWVGIIAGLLYTASSVQQWAAAGAPAWSQAWLTAWLLTAPVEVTLVAILRGEQLAARHGATPGGRVQVARLALLVLMGLLNLWGPLAAALGDGGTWGAVLAHAAVPLAVVLASEAITDLRNALGNAIASAARSAAGRAGRRPAHRRRTVPDEPDTDERSGDRTDDRADEQDGDQDGSTDQDDAGPTVRERAVAWYLDHWSPDDPEPPMGAVLRAAWLAEGRRISRGEASRSRTAAIARRAEETA